MGELNFGEAEIEDFGDSVSDKNTDASEETVDENDKLEDFPAEVAGWPDPDFPPPGP
jgi:hypothetical protein